MDHNLFKPSLDERPLGSFQFLMVIGKDDVKFACKFLVNFPFSSVEIAGSFVGANFFARNYETFTE